MLQGAVPVRATIGVVTKIKVIVLAHKNIQDIIQDIGAERRMHILPVPGKVVVPVPAELPEIIGLQVVAVRNI